MAATPSTTSTAWTYSSRRNPCPICGRTKDGDCRISAEGDRVTCHHPRDMKPGEVVNGWAFTRNTSDDRAAHFVLDRPREASSRRRLRSVPGGKADRAPQPAPINGPIRLALLPEGVDLPDLGREKATYHYSDDQRTIRDTNRQGGKVLPFHRLGDQAKPGAGADPWPLYQQGLALAADGWLLELEGERKVGIAMEAGVVAISQPGHDHKPESITRRYRTLAEASLPGVVYVSDNDTEGQRKADRCAAAAAEVGLPFFHLPASNVWPGIAEKGSIDDAPGTAAEQIAAIEAAIVTALQEQPPAEEALRANPTDPLDDLLGPAEEGKLRRPRKDKLTAALGLLLNLRYNLLTNRIEQDAEPIDGDMLGTLYLGLAEDHGLDVAKDRAIDAAIRLARKHAYHPVRNYLKGLTVTLSPEDWAAIDIRCFGREDPLGMSALHLQRQLIGLVARAMEPGCELHTCLVLQSDDQGIGKSSLWKILGGEWFSDSLGDLRDVREDRLQLHSAWIHEWGEIDNVMGKRESETLKRFLSCSRDDVRKPYGRGTEQLRRSCGLVGTTNRRDFIKDPTGNRRFPIISIREVRLDWITEYRDAIWGSALQAYRSGQRWHYDHSETAILNQHATAFAAEDPLRSQLETWLEDHPEITELPAARAVLSMGYDPERTKDREFCRQVSNAFRSLGWRQTTERRRYLLPNGDKTDKATGWIRPT